MSSGGLKTNSTLKKWWGYVQDTSKKQTFTLKYVTKTTLWENNEVALDKEGNVIFYV